MLKPGKRMISRLFVAVCLALMVRPSFVEGQSGNRRLDPPTDVSLTTKDGVQLRITYFPSNEGQGAIPVLMLHDFGETRAVFNPLATALQRPGEPEGPGPRIASRAVITVDLRGHGESKTAVADAGSTVELDATRFQLADYQAMVVQDMEAVRSFLVDQNDTGNLNLNKLVVLGSGMGANVAVLWAARDWATPPLAVRKQGQDVKALVLLSPQWNFRGLILRDAMKYRPVQQQLSIFLAFGNADRKFARDGENIGRIFERYHPEPAADQVQQRKDYFVYAPDTMLQATKLLNSREFTMGPRIASFIEARLGTSTFPWVQRKRP